MIAALSTESMPEHLAACPARAPIGRSHDGAVARDEAAQHRGIRVVDLMLAFRRAGTHHFVAGDDDSHARLGDEKVSGTVHVDKDFGAGYRYPVIVEGASVKK